MVALSTLSRTLLHMLNVYATLRLRAVRSRYAQHSGGAMPELLADLERRQSELLEEFSRLENFRAGSITALTRRCGKPGCRCSQPDDPGHGPNLRLTYKLNGKSYSQ